MAYTLGVRCASEAAGTCVAIYLGEAVIASALLAKSKGQKMGWLGISLGFGLAFGFAISMFGFISAILNPAVALGLVATGQLSARDFFCFSLSQLGGAFVGAVLVYLHFLPHFHTVPEPPAKSPQELLLRSRDALNAEGLAIASYDTRRTQRVHQGQTLRQSLNSALGDVRTFFSSDQDPAAHQRLLELALGRNELKEFSPRPTLLRRHTAGPDLHRRLERLDTQEFHSLMNIRAAGTPPGGSPRPRRRAQLDSAQDVAAIQIEHGASTGGVGVADGDAGGYGGVEPLPSPFAVDLPTEPASPPSASASVMPSGPGKASATAAAPAAAAAAVTAASRGEQLYKAALEADQNAKLSIFCTRPAIYAPVFNFLTEFLCTAMLTFGSLMIGARKGMIEQPAQGGYDAIVGGWLGFFIALCVLGLGGPTGIAANPARDFGPRLAHLLLPIPGKGSSEMYYAWIPVLAPFAGGAAGGGLFRAFMLLNQSNVNVA